MSPNWYANSGEVLASCLFLLAAHTSCLLFCFLPNLSSCRSVQNHTWRKCLLLPCVLSQMCAVCPWPRHSLFWALLCFSGDERLMLPYVHSAQQRSCSGKLAHMGVHFRCVWRDTEDVHLQVLFLVAYYVYFCMDVCVCMSGCVFVCSSAHTHVCVITQHFLFLSIC